MNKYMHSKTSKQRTLWEYPNWHNSFVIRKDSLYPGSPDRTQKYWWPPKPFAVRKVCYIEVRCMEVYLYVINIITFRAEVTDVSGNQNAAYDMTAKHSFTQGRASSVFVSNMQNDRMQNDHTLMCTRARYLYSFLQIKHKVSHGNAKCLRCSETVWMCKGFTVLWIFSVIQPGNSIWKLEINGTKYNIMYGMIMLLYLLCIIIPIY